MTAEQDLAAKVRAALARAGTLREVKMFGGTAFMLNGNMIAGVSKRGLLLRVGRDGQSDALSRPGARPMVMRGRTMEGYVYVDPAALKDSALRSWLQPAVSFVQTLPPKKTGSKQKQTKRRRK